MTLADGALLGTQVYTPESLDLKLKSHNEENFEPRMTFITPYLADIMRSCAVVMSPLSIMMETPGLGPRNEMRLLL